ncbi:MAG: prepilin peptidase [archaeon]
MDAIFFADVLLASIALIWLFAAAIQDMKKREVANWLNFSLVAIALAIRAIVSVVSSDAGYFIYGIAMTLIFFAIANLFYYARIFAGGDAKMLVALAAAFATTPVFVSSSVTSIGNIQIPFMAVFVLNMLFAGSVYGILWSAALAAKNFKEFIKEFKKSSRQNRLVRIIFFLLFAIVLLICFYVKDIILLIIALLALAFPYLLIFVKAVENSCMVKSIKACQLSEGDWLYKAVKIGKKSIMPRWEGLNNAEISLIKKSEIRRVMIKQGIPFVPVFLLALIISFFANLLVVLVGIIG